jgi:hypothetical protein
MTVKLIKHTGESEHKDDLSLPFKLEMVLREPEFMIVAWIGVYGGSEEIVARGSTLEELTTWMKQHGLKDHCRLSRYTITNAEGKVVDSFDRFAKLKEAAVGPGEEQ